MASVKGLGTFPGMRFPGHCAHNAFMALATRGNGRWGPKQENSSRNTKDQRICYPQQLRHGSLGPHTVDGQLKRVTPGGLPLITEDCGQPHKKEAGIEEEISSSVKTMTTKCSLCS